MPAGSGAAERRVCTGSAPAGSATRPAPRVLGRRRAGRTAAPAPLRLPLRRLPVLPSHLTRSQGRFAAPTAPCIRRPPLPFPAPTGPGLDPARPELRRDLALGFSLRDEACLLAPSVLMRSLGGSRVTSRELVLRWVSRDGGRPPEGRGGRHPGGVASRGDERPRPR